MAAPQAPRGLDLPFQALLHRDALAVPGHPFAVNVIRTIQPPAGMGGGGAGLILDIDVFTTRAIDVEEEVLSGHLQAMRWLKNKVFFGSVTEKTLPREEVACRLSCCYQQIFCGPVATFGIGELSPILATSQGAGVTASGSPCPAGLDSEGSAAVKPVPIVASGPPEKGCGREVAK